MSLPEFPWIFLDVYLTFSVKYISSYKDEKAIQFKLSRQHVFNIGSEQAKEEREGQADMRI